MTIVLVRGESLELNDRQIERFERYVERGPGCWLWRGPVDRHGYGAFRVGRDRFLLAHRVAFQLWADDPVDPDLQLDHLCRVRSCCRPAHLEQVTSQENTRRGQRATSTTCWAGHPLVASPYPSLAGRICRVCRAEAQRRYLERRARDPRGEKITGETSP